MSSAPTVVVKKGGVFSTLISGIFATLIVCIIAVTLLGGYGMYMVDHNLGVILGTAKSILEGVPQWDEAAPIVTELLDDRRAPEYREQLLIQARLERGGGRAGWQQAVIEIENTGERTVTYAAARVIVLDESGSPRLEQQVTLATPIAIDDHDWRGPILPGSTRILAECVHARLPADDQAEPKISVEVTDVRVWNGPKAGESSRALKAPLLPESDLAATPKAEPEDDQEE